MNLGVRNFSAKRNKKKKKTLMPEQYDLMDLMECEEL
jgi:hypothetical protein